MEETTALLDMAVELKKGGNRAGSFWKRVTHKKGSFTDESSEENVLGMKNKKSNLIVDWSLR